MSSALNSPRTIFQGRVTGQLAVTGRMQTCAGIVRGTFAQFLHRLKRYTIPSRVPASGVGLGSGRRDQQNTTRYGSFAYAKPVLRYYDHVNVLLRYPYSLLLHRQLVPLLAPRVRLQTRRGRRARKQQQRLRQLAKAVRAPV